MKKLTTLLLCLVLIAVTVFCTSASAQASVPQEVATMFADIEAAVSSERHENLPSVIERLRKNEYVQTQNVVAINGFVMYGQNQIDYLGQLNNGTGKFIQMGTDSENGFHITTIDMVDYIFTGNYDSIRYDSSGMLTHHRYGTIKNGQLEPPFFEDFYASTVNGVYTYFDEPHHVQFDQAWSPYGSSYMDSIKAAEQLAKGGTTPVAAAPAEPKKEAVSSAPSPDYILSSMYIPSEKTTVYERVYDDGYRVRISEQGFRVEQARMQAYPDWSRWGKGSGSIDALDLALLAAVPNLGHQAAWDYLTANFPDSCPIFQREFVHKRDWRGVSGDRRRYAKLSDPINDIVDYCVFEVDGNNAIVSFGGTNSLQDAATDIFIGIGADSWNAQARAATKIIEELPYDNVIVTGYSMGGYLAAHATLTNSKVKECVTFNAPGRFLDLGAILRTDKRIKNYSPRGDTVHYTGVQPGLEYLVDIDPNASVWGAMGTHDLKHLIDAFANGNSITSR